MKNLTAESFGKIALKRNVAGLVLTETHYAPDAHLPFHNHAEPYFCLVLKGAYEEIYNRQKTKLCQASTFIYHPAGESHADRFTSVGGICFDIQIGSELTKRTNFEGLTDSHCTNVKKLAYRLYAECARFDEFSSLAIEGIFLEMIAEVSRLKKAKKMAAAPWLVRATEMLREQFADNPSLEEIAREVSVHPVHLARAFRQKFHCTVGDYLRSLRIEHARHELSRSIKPLSEIAYECGFASQSHFTTVFKRETGISPSQYRKKC